MTAIQTVRSFIAKIDTNNLDGEATYNDRNHTTRGNVVGGVLTGANLVTSGTPAAFVTGGATILWGASRVLSAGFDVLTLAIATGALESQKRAMEKAIPRIALEGVKLIVSGAATAVPVLGHYVNGALLGAYVAQQATLLTADR